ncbi:MAG: TetR/AcrR family transcriptional regulator [Candidatus Dormibacteria bacterium]
MPDATPSPRSPLPDPAAAADPDPDHHLRADARRNRAAILAAAEAAFGAEGPDAPMDEIARRAGVGVGTLYRNFPTKEALLAAILAAHFEPLAAEARAAVGAADPGAAFFALVHHLAVAVQEFRALADSLRAAGVDVHAGLHAHKSAGSQELLEATGLVLARAQEAGQVRRDVSMTDVATIVGALYQAEAIAHDPARFLRCVDLVCDGLRPTP